MSTTTSSLRLTRRGRLVLGALLAVAIAAVLYFAMPFVASVANANSESSSVEFGYVLPAYGEDLWSIAESLDASSDPRDLVAEMKSLNGLETSSVRADEPLAVPLRYADAPGVLTAAEAGVTTHSH